jgi:hypothetical protein
MLENLDKVNWVELGAPQVPDLLREIQAHEPGKEFDEKHQEAWHDLIELIFPQGIIEMWDWSGPGRMMQNDLPHKVVLFLLEILEQTTSEVIGNLREMCMYWHISLWVGDPGQPRYKAYVEWASRLKEVIKQGIPIYKQLLYDPYPRLDPHFDKNARALLEDLGET